MLTPVPTTVNHKPYANEMKTHFLSKLEDCVVLRNIHPMIENGESTLYYLDYIYIYMCEGGRKLMDETNYMV